MDLTRLKAFLFKANQHGYGNDTTKITKNVDGSETITFEEENWKFHDNWVGGVNFGGRDIVSYGGTPVWIMTYYGHPLSTEIDVGNLYAFLKKALLQMPVDLPLRGPKETTEGQWQYKIAVRGEIEQFTAIEEIYFQGNKVYEATLSGGLVGNDT